MRKKILFLITSLTGGGAERVVCNLSRVLEKDADIDILINSESDRDYPHGGHVLTLGMDFTKKTYLVRPVKSPHQADEHAQEA